MNIQYNFKLKFIPSTVNNGEYIEAILDRCLAQNITRVLYPNSHDNFVNQELRLKQEYFLCSATVQDMVRRFKSSRSIYRLDSRADFTKFPDKVAIQLNESNAALTIPELMRIFVDIEKLDWDVAWDITKRTCAFTSHRIFAEDLEKWSISLLENLLPRHVQIIRKINDMHLEHMTKNDLKNFPSTTVFETDGKINMSKLAVLGSHIVNGVSKMHTHSMKTHVFKDFYELNPKKFVNITNGITPRRWLLLCNPSLSDVIYEKIGDEWPAHLEQLAELKRWAKDSAFQHHISKVKQENKLKLAEYIEKHCGITVNPASIFDVHAKHFYGFKRQLLNCLHVITLYNRIRAATPPQMITARTVIFAGKAPPGDQIQKQIIRLICAVASIVNNDPLVGDRLKVVFLENYGVSLAEQIIPAADLSQQISLAGTEASATSNMKFALNGCLILGSMDGANVEMIEELGKENMFSFGMDVNEVEKLKASGYDPMKFYNTCPEIKKCIDQIHSGFFSPRDPNKFKDIAEMLMKNDAYMVLADYHDYLRAQSEIVKTYEVS